MNLTVLGLVLVLVGMGLIALILLFLRYLQRTPPQPVAPASPTLPLSSEAVLLVEQGGRLAYASQAACDLFEISAQEANLERMARHLRPEEAFLGLCAAEGQASFTLRGSPVVGSSYSVPLDGAPALLVTLRRPTLVAESVPEASRLLDRFLQLSQAISRSLDLETVLHAVLENIAGLFPADYLEITVWQAEENYLAPFRLGSAAGEERRLEKASEHYSPHNGYTGILFGERRPLLILDKDQFHLQNPQVEAKSYPFASYLGLPLLVENNPVGTLELASLSKDAYSEEDVQVLRLIADQAAVAVQHAVLYRAGERRFQESAALTQITQAVSALRNPQELYTRLIETIAPLMEVEALGFLLYDEERRILEGEYPFIGVQPTMLSWARFPIPPGSEAESIWLSRVSLVSEEAQSDERLRLFGLDLLAVTAGIQRCALEPLLSGERMLGYLLVGDKRDGTPFSHSDLQLLRIVAAQASPLIENSALVQQSYRRAQRAETLRRIASLIGSTATLDEVLKYSLQDVARLLGADRAAIFLLDENRGALRLHPDSLFGTSPDLTLQLGRLPSDDPQYRQTITEQQSPYLSDDVNEDADLLPVYRYMARLMDIRSLMIVPLIVHERGIGELIFASQNPGAFHSNDMQTVTTAAGQLAGAIQQTRLSSQTDESLRRRVDQLTSLTRISRELNSTLDLQRLLQRVFEETVQTTSADCGAIVLFELDEALPSAPRSQPVKIMLHLGDPHSAELSAVEQAVIERNETLIIKDFEQTIDIRPTSRGSLPVSQPAHPGVRSAMIVPIAYQERVAGLIHLHSSSPYRFDESARGIAETLAIQAAIAIGNALRYQEQVRRGELLNRRVETLAKVLEINRAMQAEGSLEQALGRIAHVIQEATPFDSVLVSVYDEETASMQRLASAGLSETDMEMLRSHLQPWSSIAQILQPEFAIGRAYFIPHERLPIVPADIHTVTVLPLDPSPAPDGRDGAAWHPEDMFFIPLASNEDAPLGLISLDTPRDGLRPDRTTIESFEIFAAQAAVVIENRRRLEVLEASLANTRLDLAQLQEAVAASQALLTREAEQSLAIANLSQRASRIRHGIDIAEVVNRQADRQGILSALGGEMVTRLQLDIALAAENGPYGPRLIYALGNLPRDMNVEALLGQLNPLSHCLQSGETLLVSRLDESPEWSGSPLLQAAGAAGFICLPVLTQGEPDSAILTLSRSPLPDFTAEDEQLFTLLARLAGISLQNAGLLSQTSQRLDEVNLLLDFSRQLGSLDPNHILQTLVESARRLLPQAEAGMVAVWDQKQGLLVPQAASGYLNQERLLEIAYYPGEALPGQVFQSGVALRVDEVDFARQYELAPDNLLHYRDATGGRLPVAALLVPLKQSPQADPLGVLVLDCYSAPAAFSAADQALVASLVQQTVLSLENTRLYRAAEQRAVQLQALTQAAGSITSHLEPQELVDSLLDQLATILPYDTGTIWLLQDGQAVVQAARGFEDNEERVGIRVAVEDSQLLSEMIQTASPVSVGDVRWDGRFPSLAEPERLSWLGLPLLASRKVTGLIALEKVEPDFYTPEDIQIAVTFAGQAAVALENARLFQDSLSRAFELDERSQRLEMLNRLTSALSETLDASRILEITSRELYQAIQCSSVSALLFEPESQAFLMAEYPSRSTTLPAFLPQAPLFERLRQTLGVYYCEETATDPELAPLAEHLASHGTHALLVLPLATGDDLHGLFLVHTQDPYHFHSDEVGLGRTISNQAAISIQNAKLYAETRSLSEDLEQRVVERTAELGREHQRAETLLRIITELSASLDLEQVLNRTLKVLNEIVDAEHISVLILREGQTKLHHLASVGYIPVPHDADRVTDFSADQGLAGWVISHRIPALIDNVLDDDRWVQRPGAPSEHRSAIGVPLIIGEEALGAVLFFHRQPSHFSTAQLDLVQAAAKQVAVAVNNAELYRLIRDQAEDLGKLLRDQQVEASRSRAILEAVADGVLVTDAEGSVTLFNASAERILELKRGQVMGKSLETFTGLFGRATQPWMDLIRSWSEQPDLPPVGELYEEQITLEDGRVVSVHLAPVSLRSQFLGTVSIFRDITHQVEVDRLKSEFVATVSHELRTPMTSIKGYVDILLMGAAGELTERQSHFLEIVKSNTERLTVLVNDLLDISRIETGRATLALQPLDLGEAAHAAVERLERRSQQENKPMHIRLKPGRKLPQVMADPERLALILDNLLENAYYYTAEDGDITIALRQAGDEVQVDVQDSGIGIPPDLQPRVFDRFYRGEHPYVLATSGTGLGLSIVQNLVEMHNGRIWLESNGTPGQGSTFSFTLPVLTAEPQPAPEASLP